MPEGAAVVRQPLQVEAASQRQQELAPPASAAGALVPAHRRQATGRITQASGSQLPHLPAPHNLLCAGSLSSVELIQRQCQLHLLVEERSLQGGSAQDLSFTLPECHPTACR